MTNAIPLLLRGITKTTQLLALCLSLGSVALAQELHKKEHLDFLSSLDSKATLSSHELSQARQTMLALMNEARANPNYRRASGSKTDLVLQAGLPPLQLDERANAMAQEQSNYQASIDKLTHDNSNYKDYGSRLIAHLGKAYGPEACGSGPLSVYPMNWMTSETHYREVWNLGASPTTHVGFGMAKSKGGTWYATAIWTSIDPSLNPPLPTPTQTRGTELKTGEVLNLGEELQSPNGNFVFRALDGSSSGQFGVYSAQNGIITNLKPHTLLGKTDQGKVRISLGDDGNLLILNLNNEVTWASSTVPYGDPKFNDANLKPVKLMIDDAGVISLYAQSGERVWYHLP